MAPCESESGQRLAGSEDAQHRIPKHCLGLMAREQSTPCTALETQRHATDLAELSSGVAHGADGCRGHGIARAQGQLGGGESRGGGDTESDGEGAEHYLTAHDSREQT